MRLLIGDSLICGSIKVNSYERQRDNENIDSGSDDVNDNNENNINNCLPSVIDLAAVLTSRMFQH